MAITSDIFGALNITDDDSVYVKTSGQEALFDATQGILGDHNNDVLELENFFVERETSAHTSRYYLETGSRLEKITNSTRPAARKVVGSWDTAYRLEEFGDRISGTRVQMAYMSLAQYGRHIMGVLKSDVNTRRFEILRALFNNGGGAPIPFLDERWGSLNVQPLANGDATLYPPVVGSEINAVQNNYLVTQFAPSAISDTNDPITTAVDQIELLFDYPTGGSNIVTFVNKANAPKIMAMTEFNPVEARFQQFGDDITRATNYPTGLPGRVLGEFGGKSLIAQWQRIPANYMLSMHLDAPRPLVRRIDDPETGLTPGLTLRTTFAKEPYKDAIWTNRFGYGVGNRLNGVITFIDAGSTYTVPAAYNVT